MLHNYETEKFSVFYFLICFIGLVILFLVEKFLLLLPFAVCFLTCGLVVVILLMGYFLIIGEMKRIYQDIHQISAMMTQAVENVSLLQKETYKQGDLGILYTNFYKMVHIMEDNKNDIQKEKVFLQEVISDISHQLKTPLASLNVFMNLLYEDKVTDPEKKKQILAEAQNQLNRMEWMVLSMLKLSRIEAGAIQFEKEACHLEQVLSEAKEAVKYLTEERNQTVTILRNEKDKVGNEEGLKCDSAWLCEALINLLKNASDYSPQGRAITVETERNELFTRIYVKDQGMGIPEEALPHIFKRFYRVNQGVNPNSVGIGLALTKSIVEGMGGQISVRSKAGEYTWFILTFPVNR